MFRKVIITLAVIIAFGYWFKDFMRSDNGKFIKFMNTHPNQTINPRVEYIWATLLDLANKRASAKYYYQE